MKKAAAAFNQWGVKIKAAGIQFGYHPHGFEFVHTPTQTLFDVLAAETKPDLVTFELDTFWFAIAGADPAAFLERYPNHAFCSLQGEAGNIKGAGIGQQNATVTIDDAADALRHPAPHVDRESIPRPNNIIRPHRHIEWGVATRTPARHRGHAPVHEHFGTKPLQRGSLFWNLRIQIAHRLEIVGRRPPKNLRHVSGRISRLSSAPLLATQGVPHSVHGLDRARGNIRLIRR